MDARAGSGASVISTVYFDASEDSLPGSPVSIGAHQDCGVQPSRVHHCISLLATDLSSGQTASAYAYDA